MYSDIMLILFHLFDIVMEYWSQYPLQRKFVQDARVFTFMSSP